MSKKPYNSMKAMASVAAKFINDKRSVDEVKPVCEHDWVYKILFDHTACDVCTKCKEVRKQTG